MPLIERRSGFLVPVNGEAALDSSYARGLAALIVFDAGKPRDLITGWRPSSTANFTPQLVSDVRGRTALSGKTSSGASGGVRSFLGSNPASAIVLAAPSSTAAIRPFFSQRPSAGGTQWTFAANMDAGFGASSGRLTMSTNGGLSLSVSPAITGSLSVYGFSVTSTTAGQLYVDGATVSTTAIGTGYGGSSSPDFNIGYHAGASATNTEPIALIALWNRALSDQEHAELASDLRKLFAPRRFFVQASAGAGQSSHPLLSSMFASSIFRSPVIRAAQDEA